MTTPPPIVMHVLSNVGKLRKLAECAHHRYSGFVAELIEDHVQFVPGLGILLTPEPDRRLADIFDEIKSRLTFLLAQRITQHSPEQANIFPQRIVLDWTICMVQVVFFEIFAARSKRSHGKTPLGKISFATQTLILRARVRVGAWRAKMGIGINSAIFPT
jgi:hypothetical protein